MRDSACPQPDRAGAAPETPPHLGTRHAFCYSDGWVCANVDGMALKNLLARGYYSPSCLGPVSGPGTLAPPRLSFTPVPPPNLQLAFTDGYILTSSEGQPHMLWIACG